ncbi:MAG: choice-of-anchor D domain-containing protein [Myxococcales bacterium]|nr:choice-of-anchor D domain-containing protein [Myxococcales bacterium]
MRQGWWWLLGALIVACAERERPRLSDGRLLVSGKLEFGTVVVHKRRELDVVLRNVGRGPLTIDDVWTIGPEGTYLARAGCKWPRLLSSNAECPIRVRYSPSNGGAHPGVLVVRTDSTEEPFFRVEMSGNGLEAAAVISPEAIDFGRIEADSDKTAAVTLQNPSPVQVEPTLQLVGADRDELSLPAGALVLAPGERRTMELSFHPGRVGRKLVALVFTPCEGCADRIVAIAAESLEQAVVAEPPLLDFGQLPIDRDRTMQVKLRNLSTEPMEVTRQSLAPSTDPSFRAAPSAVPLTIDPMGAVDFDFTYSPGHMGLALGLAHFHVPSKRHPTTDVQLRAFGGSSELCLAPFDYDFGERPVGSRNWTALVVKNCGASNASPMTVHGVDLGPHPSLGGAEHFSVDPGPLPKSLAAGEELVVKVFYEPLGDGQSGASIQVRGDAFPGGLSRATFSGKGRTFPPCQVAVRPAGVDFGTVRPGHSAILGVKVENVGTDLCAVKNIGLADDGAGAFRLPGGPIDGLLVPSGNSFTFQVRFDAGLLQASFSGAVRIEVADPGNPLRFVSLRANTQASCVVARPRFLDFGQVRPDCPPAPQEVKVENVCASTETVLQAYVGPGTTDGEYAVSATSAPLPVALGPGDSFTAEVTYQGIVIGPNYSPLFVDVIGLNAPLLVPLHGESSSRAERTDLFVQQDGSKVDVLFVVDNTASMVEEHPRLIDALPAFASAALLRQVDLHVAVTTTGIEPVSGSCPGGAEGGEAGRLFPADNSAPRLLTDKTPGLGSALQKNAAVGQCAFVEKGLEAMRRALSYPLVDHSDDPRTSLPSDGNLGFLRDEAGLAVVVVGDEDDHSPDDVESYVRFLFGLKGTNQPARATVYAIAPTGSGCSSAGGTGTRYVEAAQRTGGEAMSVCASDYEPILKTVAAKAFSPQDRFPLSFPPDPASVSVSVDGVPVSGWTYDAAANQIVFGARPAPGSRIAVSYRRACPAP